jgi:hypothetical protein
MRKPIPGSSVEHYLKFSYIIFDNSWTKYCHVYESDCGCSFRLEIGFIDHLQIVTTGNCNTIANFLNLQITAAHAKSFQSAVSSPVVPW